MGILNKLLFWRRDDELDFDKLAAEQLKTGIKDDPFGSNQSDIEERSPFPEEPARPTTARGSPYRQTNFQPQASAFSPPAENIQKDLELISSKLDTIKVMLSSLDQRTANLERAAGVQQQQRQRLW